MILKAYLDNKEVVCRNLDSLSWDYVSNDGSPNAILLEELELELPKLAFDDFGDGLNVLNSFIQANGILKKISVQIRDSVAGIVFDGLGDISRSRLTCDVAFLRAESTIKSFIEQANGLNLRKLYDNPAIPASQQLTVNINGGDINPINFVINRPAAASAELAVMVSIGLTVTTQIVAIVKNITDGAFSTAAFQPWFALSTALQIIVTGIAIIGALITAFDLLIARVRQYYYVKVLPLLEKGCANLGFSFDSSIFVDFDWAQLATIGGTSELGAKTTSLPTNNPVPDMTLGDLIGELEKIFYARTKVQGNSVVFEPREYFFNNPSNFEIQNTQSQLGEDVPSYTYNTSEIPASYRFGFATDSFDNNTIDETTGTTIVATYSMLSGEMNNLTSQIDNSTKFARASRRTEDTAIERLFNSISDEFNDLFAGTLPLNGDRIGMLELDAEFIGTPKLFIVNEARRRIRPVSDEKVNARYLYNTYHKEHASPLGVWSRWTIVEGIAPQPICSGDGGSAELILAQLRENNVATDYLGRLAVIESQIRGENGMYEFRYRTTGWVNPLAGGADIPAGAIQTKITEN